MIKKFIPKNSSTFSIRLYLILPKSKLTSNIKEKDKEKEWGKLHTQDLQSGKEVILKKPKIICCNLPQYAYSWSELLITIYLPTVKNKIKR